MIMKKRDLAIGLLSAVGAAVAVKMLTRAGTVNWDDVSDVVEHSDHSHFITVDGAGFIIRSLAMGPTRRWF